MTQNTPPNDLKQDSTPTNSSTESEIPQDLPLHTYGETTSQLRDQCINIIEKSKLKLKRWAVISFYSWVATMTLLIGLGGFFWLKDAVEDEVRVQVAEKFDRMEVDIDNKRLEMRSAVRNFALEISELKNKKEEVLSNLNKDWIELEDAYKKMGNALERSTTDVATQMERARIHIEQLENLHAQLESMENQISTLRERIEKESQDLRIGLEDQRLVAETVKKETNKVDERLARLEQTSTAGAERGTYYVPTTVTDDNNTHDSPVIESEVVEQQYFLVVDVNKKTISESIIRSLTLLAEKPVFDAISTTTSGILNNRTLEEYWGIENGFTKNRKGILIIYPIGAKEAAKQVQRTILDTDHNLDGKIHLASRHQTEEKNPNIIAIYPLREH